MSELLVVSQEAELSLRYLLEARGHRVDHVSSGAAAMGRVRRYTHDAVIVRHRDHVSTVNLSRALRDVGRGLPVLVVCRTLSESARVALASCELEHVLVEPFDAVALLAKIQRLLQPETGRGAPQDVDALFDLDVERSVLTIGEETVMLSQRQVRLMQCLVEHARERRGAAWRTLVRDVFETDDVEAHSLALEAELEAVRELLGPHRWRLRARTGVGVLLVLALAESGTYSIDGIERARSVPSTASAPRRFFSR